MSATLTRTRSASSSATKARVAYALQRVQAEWIGAVQRYFLSQVALQNWLEDLEYILLTNAAEFFEIQFFDGDMRIGGLRYVVCDDGSPVADQHSGGVNYWGLPRNTSSKLVARSTPWMH